ncbi:MAG: helix-turn-helix domain-containing protein [Actinophytocola sp.]|uniref:IclR family transcriptional regulator n=1 Tax=Actinophytocola sp. TaxID=1872138 RepID=UPI001324B6FA|nr:IclR family transcriptional regulator [Actinophytocola sp.]MPZ80896.1 helix-turn-helix domain-containing protein [Actinophytocola sp.]
MAEEGTNSVWRVIAILTALGEWDPGDQRTMGVIETARVVGREKSQVSRTLKTLAESGLVDRDPDTLGYRLGWRFFSLAARAGDHQLLACAPEIMRGLVRTVGERVHLSVRDGTDALTLLSENATRSVQTVSLVGHATPVHATSCGQALLFDMSANDIRELLGRVRLVARGPKAPRTVEDFIGRVQRAAAKGFSTCIDEFDTDLAATAAPVRDFRGRIVAAINISGPKFRIAHDLESAGRQVKAAAGYLSKNLGWDGLEAPVKIVPRKSS